MLRKIININEEKCNGCGLCVNACHEGAIALENGKAKLTREDYCDGLGNCLPACPTGAITFEEREAAAFEESAVVLSKETPEVKPLAGGCPGTQSRILVRAPQAAEKKPEPQTTGDTPSQLGQWPCQIKLVPINAPYFKGANLLIAADCTAYAYGSFHKDFMANKVTIIGCPKLDEGSYAEKLTAILKLNNIKSVTITRMEVPCCGGLAAAATKALRDCGKMIPWSIVTIGVNGEIIEQ